MARRIPSCHLHLRQLHQITFTTDSKVLIPLLVDRLTVERSGMRRRVAELGELSKYRGKARAKPITVVSEALSESLVDVLVFADDESETAETVWPTFHEVNAL